MRFAPMRPTVIDRRPTIGGRAGRPHSGSNPWKAGACSASRLAARTHHRHPADLPQRRAGPGGMVEGVGAEDSIERTIIDRPDFG